MMILRFVGVRGPSSRKHRFPLETMGRGSLTPKRKISLEMGFLSELCEGVFVGECNTGTIFCESEVFQFSK